MLLEQTAKRERAENGRAEEAEKTTNDYACTFISQVEKGIGEELPEDSFIYLWIVRWAATCYSRYVVGKCGRGARKIEGKAMQSGGCAHRGKGYGTRG